MKANNTKKIMKVAKAGKNGAIWCLGTAVFVGTAAVAGSVFVFNKLRDLHSEHKDYDESDYYNESECLNPNRHKRTSCCSCETCEGCEGCEGCEESRDARCPINCGGCSGCRGHKSWDTTDDLVDDLVHMQKIKDKDLTDEMTKVMAEALAEEAAEADLEDSEAYEDADDIEDSEACETEADVRSKIERLSDIAEDNTEEILKLLSDIKERVVYEAEAAGVPEAIDTLKSDIIDSAAKVDKKVTKWGLTAAKVVAEKLGEHQEKLDNVNTESEESSEIEKFFKEDDGNKVKLMGNVTIEELQKFLADHDKDAANLAKTDSEVKVTPEAPYVHQISLDEIMPKKADPNEISEFFEEPHDIPDLGGAMFIRAKIEAKAKPEVKPEAVKEVKEPKSIKKAKAPKKVESAEIAANAASKILNSEVLAEEPSTEPTTGSDAKPAKPAKPAKAKQAPKVKKEDSEKVKITKDDEAELTEPAAKPAKAKRAPKVKKDKSETEGK